MVILALGAWLASRAQIRPSEVVNALQSLGWRPAILAFTCSFLQLFFIILRYQALAPREYAPSLRRTTYAVGLGHSLNTFFPARAGDVLKCFLLGQGAQSRMSVLGAAGLVLGDRVVDVAVLFAMGFAWNSYQHPKMQQWLGGFTANAGVWIGIAVFVIFATVGWILLRRFKHSSQWAGEFRTGLLGLTRPIPLLLGIGLAFLAWGAEAKSLQILAQTQGLGLTFGHALFVLIMLNFAVSIPLSFANLGPFEAAIALSLATFGLAYSPALAVATVHHGLQLFAVMVWTVIAVVVRPRH